MEGWAEGQACQTWERGPPSAPAEITLADIDIAEFVQMERAIGVISIGISIS